MTMRQTVPPVYAVGMIREARQSTDRRLEDIKMLTDLVVHSAEHAQALAKSFELMAEYITSKEGGK